MISGLQNYTFNRLYKKSNMCTGCNVKQGVKQLAVYASSSREV